jgi:hypothetical protein
MADVAMDLDTRCQETSFNYGKGTPTKPYGPGGYNRCVKGAAPHTLHEDEWGNRWIYTQKGKFKTVQQGR